jgi:LDH2 family malate/lactate/ureidoglycolate dehydrogenase
VTTPPTGSPVVVVQRTVAAGWALAILTAIGAAADPARHTVEHLLAAEDAGHPSHGLRMLVAIAGAAQRGELDPAATPVVSAASGSVAQIDGRTGLGPPAGALAVAEAVRRARRHGCAAVTVRAATNLGRLAPYAQTAAHSGCASFLCANDGGANQRVVPAGATAGRLSTNPIAFGFPRSAPPHLVVDMATSTYAHGTLGALVEAGRPLPPDALLNAASELMLPMAGYKGFALAIMVEALAGALTGAGVVGDPPPPESQGALMVALDVAALADADRAIADLERALAWVRSSPPAADRPVRIPGEGRAPGAGSEVAIAPGLWTALTELSARLHVDAPTARAGRRPEPERAR